MLQISKSVSIPAAMSVSSSVNLMKKKKQKKDWIQLNRPLLLKEFLSDKIALADCSENGPELRISNSML